MMSSTEGTLAPLYSQALIKTHSCVWCLLFLLSAMTVPLAAEAACGPSTVVNRVAVEFLSGKEKIPLTLELIDEGAPQKPKLTVTNAGAVYWVAESSNGLIGAKRQFRPDLSISGYSIAAVKGINRIIDNKCYALFSFKLEKVAWTLEVSPNPSFPFSFKANNTDYSLRSPQQDGKTWNLVEGLSPNDVVSLKIYELQGDKSIYLFSIDFRSALKQIYEDPDEIAKKILLARSSYSFGKIKLSTDLDPADPYLEIAKQQMSSNSVPADAAAKERVKALLQLKGLDLRDKTEVKP
jgi:hypothetical protein